MTNKSPQIIPQVLFLNPWDKLIGPNRYLKEMLSYAPELARQATVVFHQHGDALEEYRNLGCQVLVWEEISQIRAKPSLTNLLNLVNRHTLGLGRVIRGVVGCQPDLIVSNTEQLLLGDLAAKLLGIPHLKVFHAITFAYRLQGQPLKIKAYLKTFTCGTDRVIAVSDTLKRELSSGGLLKENITTVPNPIPIQALQADSLNPLTDTLQEQMKNKGPILLNAGRIAPLKGQDLLIAALQAVKRKYPNVLCIFAGQLGADSGLEDPNAFLSFLQRRIQDLGLTDNILFAGEIDYLPSLMRCADLYVHTSMMESFCRAVAEALTCDTPVVAFDAGAIAEVAGPGAILVRTGDTDALAAAILDLLPQQEKRYLLAERGRRHIQKYYAAGQISHKFTEILAQQSRQERCRKVRECAG